MPHLFGDGIAVLHELKTTFQGTLTDMEVMQLHGKLLGGLHFRDRTESIEQFAARTLQISKDLTAHGVFVLPKHLKTSFITGLGPEFHDIIKDLNRNKLDPEWSPMFIRDLIEPARKYLRLQTKLRSHHAQYKQHTSTDPTKSSNDKKSPSQNKTNDTKSKDQIDRDRKRRIHEAIAAGTFKISDFQSEVRPGHCVFHDLTHTRTGDSNMACTRLKELLSTKPEQKPNPSNNPNTPTPTAQKQAPVAKQTTIQSPSHTTPIHSQQADSDSTVKQNEALNQAIDTLTEFGEAVNNQSTKSTNSIYSCITCKSVTIQHNYAINTNIVIDPGAFPMMFQSKQFFTDLQPWNHPTNTHVTLADGVTKAPIQGIGTIRALLNQSHTIELHNVLYVPSLTSNLFSVKEFVRYNGTLTLAENNSFTIAFPTFIIIVPIQDEITLSITPSK